MPSDTARIAQRLRRKTERVLVRTGNMGGPTRLHLIDEDGENLCSKYDHDHHSEPVEKSVSAYPPGYAQWCVRCARAETGETDLEGPIVHPGDGERDGGVA